MRAIVKSLSRSVSRPSSAWLTLLLLLVVLAPSVCLLWFVNQAVKNERLAVRQKLVDAYRGHLVLAQQRLESYWRDMADDLDAQAETLSPPALFAKQVFAGVADAVICFDAAGNVVYPGAALPGISEPADKRWTEAQQMESGDLAGAAKAFAIVAQQATDTGLAARAWQAQARCLVREGKKEEALAVLLGPLAEEQYQHTTDAQGRLLVPNAQLMALELLNDTDSGRASVLCARLKRQLSDYDDLSISAAQRRFLMRELQRFDPDQAILAMLSAEDLAAAYIEAGQSENGLQAGTKGTTPHPGPLPFRRGEGESSTASLQSESHPHSQEEDKPAAGHAAQPELRATSLPGVWQFASSRGRVVLLYKGTEALLARIAGPAGLKNLPSDVVVTLLPPGREAEGFFVSLPAGPTLPDWRLALALKDQKLFDAATDQRVASYVWIGVLVVAGVIVLALLILRLVRRQMALTKLRNDLVANVTHELKTPLSGMRLLVDTLLNSPKLHEPTVREYLALIAKENLRLSRLIDNFLAFSRMERNKYTLDFNEVPARAIVEGAAAAVQERFNAPDCRFQVQMASNLPPIVADADAMVTAVVNLLDNAWKYSGDEKQITLTAAADNGSVIFAVQDNGIGLSPRDTKRIFKRFYQVDQRLARSAGGCGLGLSIVKFIVTAHGGAVKVESELGRGSRFMLVLPGQSRNPKSECRKTVEMGTNMNAKRILIVEDDPALLRGLKDNFQAEGYQVRTAIDGQRGLAAILQDPPDVVLLDLRLPKINGYEICRAARSRHLHTPIIMLTAKGGEEDIFRGLQLGADDYITKPFSIRELIARTQALCGLEEAYSSLLDRQGGRHDGDELIGEGRWPNPKAEIRRPKEIRNPNSEHGVSHDN